MTETGYYTDADGDWIHNESELVSGLKQFYRETGVQPYVYILPNGESILSAQFWGEAVQPVFQDA